MEIYKSKQTNREPDLSDYKEYKLKEDNKGEYHCPFKKYKRIIVMHKICSRKVFKCCKNSVGLKAKDWVSMEVASSIRSISTHCA